MTTRRGGKGEAARLLRCLQCGAFRCNMTSFFLLHLLFWVSCYTTLPKFSHPPPSTNSRHVPLQRVKDGGLHYVVPGGELVEAFLLHLGVVFSLSVVVLLLVGKAAATLVSQQCKCRILSPSICVTLSLSTVLHIRYLTWLSCACHEVGRTSNEGLRKWEPESHRVGLCRDSTLRAVYRGHVSYLISLGTRFLPLHRVITPIWLLSGFHELSFEEPSTT